MGLISMILNVNNQTFYWNDLVGAAAMLPFISGMGILCLYGIPFVVIQVICFHQIIFEGNNLLHNWFATAYCQAILMYLSTSVVQGRGFWREHTTDLAIALFVLGILHAFLTWVIIWSNKKLRKQE